MIKILLLFFITTNILFSAININTATLQELITLEDIDEKKAKKIIKHRKKKCFRTVKELTKIKCICKSTLKKNSGKISATGCDRPKKKKKDKKKKKNKKKNKN